VLQRLAGLAELMTSKESGMLQLISINRHSESEESSTMADSTSQDFDLEGRG
jgi:hypothetical protein